NVTGVQTCALPICIVRQSQWRGLLDSEFECASEWIPSHFADGSEHSAILFSRTESANSLHAAMASRIAISTASRNRFGSFLCRIAWFKAIRLLQWEPGSSHG